MEEHPSINPKSPNEDGGCTFPITLIPDEIIFEILIRLSQKSICQLKCLSKDWLSFLSSHRFISAYSSLSPHPPSWLLVDLEGRLVPGPNPNPNLDSDLTFFPSQPPNISYLTLSAVPSRIFKTSKLTVLTSSNGLILSILTPSNLLFIFNPVTHDWASLPAPKCCTIGHLPRVAFSAKYTPTCDDVSLVVIEYHSTPLGVSLMTYRSVTGKWESRPASFRAGSIVHQTCPTCSADGTLEVNGNLFWIDLRCGLVVLDDPFGERAELRYIPLPPKGRSKLQISRLVSLVSGFVQCFVIKDRDVVRIWRLNDVEEGKWGVLYKLDYQKWIELHQGGLRLSALHPFDADLAILTREDKVAVVSSSKYEVVEIVSYPKNAKRHELYIPVVLPTWPIPLPLSLRATSAKENGNIYFKNKYFKEALVYYSRSISCLPTASAYANRGSANLQLGKYQEAEMDFSEVLKIDQHYVKVYVRRAIVRKELGMFCKAKEDVEMALKLDGQHHEILKLYSEIISLLEKPV